MADAITTLEQLINELLKAPDAELIFSVEGENIRPDYHVTEIKLAHVHGLDCGRQIDEWDESLVQLLDGPVIPDPDAAFMSVSTFLKIAGAGHSAVQASDGGQLYFEFAADHRGLRKLTIQSVSTKEGRTLVELGPVAAICKPALRRQTEGATQTGCCAPVPEVSTPQARGACCAADKLAP